MTYGNRKPEKDVKHPVSLSSRLIELGCVVDASNLALNSQNDYEEKAFKQASTARGNLRK